MATFTITHEQRLDDVAVVQTLTATDITVGQQITITGCDPTVNGTRIVIAAHPYRFTGLSPEGDIEFDADDIIVNQLFVQASGPTIHRRPVEPFGTLTWTEQCSWINAAAVQEWLGIPVATSNDTAFITTCVNAANDWAFRRRKAAGYTDSLSAVPSRDVKLGVTILAAAWYRERGSVDSYASFTDMGAAQPILSMGNVHRLLGINRSQVA